MNNIEIKYHLCKTSLIQHYGCNNWILGASIVLNKMPDELIPMYPPKKKIHGEGIIVHVLPALSNIFPTISIPLISHKLVLFDPASQGTCKKRDIFLNISSLSYLQNGNEISPMQIFFLFQVSNLKFEQHSVSPSCTNNPLVVVVWFNIYFSNLSAI